MLTQIIEEQLCHYVRTVSNYFISQDFYFSRSDSSRISITGNNGYLVEFS